MNTGERNNDQFLHPIIHHIEVVDREQGFGEGSTPDHFETDATGKTVVHRFPLVDQQLLDSQKNEEEEVE